MPVDRQDRLIFKTLEGLEPLVVKDGFIHSYIQFTNIDTYDCDFTVYSVLSCEYPSNEPIDGEFMFSCTFKFDGTAQYFIGDDDGCLCFGDLETEYFIESLKLSHNMALQRMS